MPRKSLQRKKLDAALEQASDPAVIATISDQINKVEYRAERQRRKKKAATTKEADVMAEVQRLEAAGVDLTATITFEPPTPVVLSPWSAGSCWYSLPEWMQDCHSRPPEGYVPDPQYFSQVEGGWLRNSNPFAPEPAPRPRPTRKPTPAAVADGETITRSSLAPPWIDEDYSRAPDTAPDLGAAIIGGYEGQCLSHHGFNNADGFSFTAYDPEGRPYKTNQRIEREAKERGEREPPMRWW